MILIKIQLVRYEENQERAKSVMPRDERMCNRRERLGVPKAEGKSKRQITK